MKININPADLQANYYDESFIKEYAQQNKEDLKRVSFKGEKSVLLVVATVNGWCTLVSVNTGAIIQGWAGEFVAG